MKKPTWMAGVAAFGCGSLCHLFGLVTMLHNNDDIAQLPYGYGTGLTSGRWLLTILGDLSGAADLSYNLPLVNGLIFLLLISLAAALVTDVLGIQNRQYAALTGMVFSVFPSVAATMFFRYTVVYYGIALVLAVGAVWMTEHHRLGFLASVAAIALSMGIYQAYVPFAIGLYVLLLIRKLIRGDAALWSVVKRGLFYCMVLALGVGLYFLCNSLCLALYGTQLSDYNGVNEMGQISLSELPHMLKMSLYTFVMLPVKGYCGLANSLPLRLLWVLLGVMGMAVVVWAMQGKLPGLLLKAAILVLCGLFPVAVNFIQIMSPNGWIYTLMLYPMVLVPLLPVVILEAMGEKTAGKRTEKLLALILAALVFCYGYDTNVNYTAAHYSNRQTENYLNNMLVQVRMTEGFAPNQKWAFLGKIKDPLFRSPWQYESVYGGNEDAPTLINRPTRWYWFQMYCGYTVPLATEEESAELARLEEVREMPCWPAEGSVRVIGEYVVIKCEELS